MPAELSCDAFPDGVPDAIFDNEVDHRRPVEGDRGLRFVPIERYTAADMDRLVFKRG